MFVLYLNILLFKSIKILKEVISLQVPSHHIQTWTSPSCWLGTLSPPDHTLVSSLAKHFSSQTRCSPAHQELYF